MKKLLIAAFIVLNVLSLLVLKQREKKTWIPKYVFLIACDTLRADHLHCYGYPRDTTPNIDHLAREGAMFENAFSPSNNTRVSFQSILTGLYPSGKEENLPIGPPTIASTLAAHGMATAAFVGGGYLSREFKTDRGFEIYDVQSFGWLHHGVQRSMEWLDSHHDDQRPAFLFIHGYDAHTPYIKPLHFTWLMQRHSRSSLVDTLLYSQSPLKVQNGAYNPTHGSPVPLSADVREGVVDGYDAGIHYADFYVGLIMSKIYSLGIENQSLVILFGDHGEELLEDGLWGHRSRLVDCELHVPLIIWGPGGISAHRCSQLVEITRVFPTILDYLRLPPLTKATGSSLRTLIANAEREDSNALAMSRLDQLCSIRSSDWRYTISLTGARGSEAGLFDAHTDPFCRSDVSTFHKDVVARLAEQLQQRLRAPHL